MLYLFQMGRHNIKQRIFNLILVICFVVSSLGINSQYFYADEKDEYIAQLQQRENETQQTISNLQKQTQETQSAISSLQNQKQETQNNVRN